MAHTIKLKRTSTAGNKPDNTNITTGELALNTADKSLYIQTGTANTDIVTLYDDGILHLDDTNNRVGIGTTSPTKFLHLNYNSSSTARTGEGLAGGAAGGGFLIQNTNSGNNTYANLDFRASTADGRIVYQYTGTQNQGDFHFITDNTNSPATAMTIKNDGKVGIGTTAPGEKLEVIGNVEAEEFIGDIRGATLFKASAGEALSKGDVVYISGISGNTTVVSKADADDAAKMPAFGIAAAAASVNNPVDIYTSGILSGIDTSSYSEGDELFVSTTAGALTATAPTGESAALQKIGKVTRSAASGSIFIIGAGRTNAVPNLNEGKLFVGNSSNQAVADNTMHVDIANSRVGIGTTSPTKALDVVGRGAFSDILHVSKDIQHPVGTGQWKITNKALNGYTRFAVTDSNGTETNVLNIRPNGNVGIGDTSPSATLDVYNASAESIARFISGSNRTRIQISDDDTDVYVIAEGSKMSLGAANSLSSTNLTIDSSGNVGIGTTSPAATLHVNDDSADAIIQLSGNSANPTKLINDGTDFEIQETSNRIRLRARNAGNLSLFARDSNGSSKEFLTIEDTSGNIGVNNTNPAHQLDVTGGARIVTTASGGNNGQIFLGTSGNNSYPIFSIGTSSSSSDFRIWNVGNWILGTYASQDLSFYTDSAERIRIDSSGNVGIGTTSPDAKLVISSGGTTAAHSDTDLLVRHSSAASTTAQVQILSGNTGASNLYFSDTDAYSVGGFQYNHSNNYLAVRVNAAERMRIDSSGNLLVGTTSSNAGITATSGNSFVYRPAAELTVARQGSGTTSPVAIFNQTGDDGQILDLRKDGTTVGSIGTYGDYPYFANTTRGIKMVGSALYPTYGNGNTAPDLVDIGSSTTEFKDLYLSGQVNTGTISSGNITTSGTITFSNSHYLQAGTGNLFFKNSSNAALGGIDAAGFNTAYNYQISGTTVITSARQITNVTSITATGAISTTGTASLGAINVGSSTSGNVFFKRPNANYIFADQSGGYLVFGTNGRSTSVANSNFYLGTNQDVTFNGSISIASNVTSSGLFTSNQNQQGFRHIAPDVMSGHTSRNEMTFSWTADETRWYMFPTVDGSSNFGRELSFDYSSEEWSIEGPVTLSSLSTTAATASSFAGDVLVGKTSSAFNTAGAEIAASGRARFTRDSANVVEINRTTDAGSIITFNVDGSMVGNIGSSAARLFIHNNYGNGSGFRFDNGSINPASSSGANEDNTTDLGTSSVRFKDLHLSGQVNTGTISSGNITTTGYLAGPATFTIDPAAVGDNTGTVVIAGNLQVDGTTTTINSTTVTVDDLNITLASGSTNKAAANGAGLTVDCGSDTDATLTYHATGDRWELNKPLRWTYATATTALALNNNNIIEVNNIAFADPGASEGLSWSGGNMALFESPNDLSNASGNLQVTYGGTRRFTVDNTGIDVVGKGKFRGTTDGASVLELGQHDNSANTPLVTVYTDDGGSTRPFGGDSLEFNFSRYGQQIGATRGSAAGGNVRSWKFGTTTNGDERGIDLFIYSQGDSSATGSTGTSTNVQISATSNRNSYINTSGNFGLGTNNPTSKLHVIGASAKARIQDSSNNYALDLQMSSSLGKISTSADLALRPGGVESVRLKSDGKVGIGTTSPDTSVDITSDGVQGLILNQDSSNSSASSRIFLKSAQRTNTILNVSGNTEFRTGAAIGSTSGTVRLAINGSTGNVGIGGTTSPSQKLHVTSGSANSNTLTLIEPGTTAGNYSALQVGRTDGSGVVQVADAVSGGIPIAGTAGILLGSNSTSLPAVGIRTPNSSAGHIVFNPKGTEKVRITADGNVGIGTSSPSRNLDIRSPSSAAAIKLRREDTAKEMLILIGSSYGYVQNTTGPLGLGGSNGDRDILIDTSGRVGIGTISPGTKLQISDSATPVMRIEHSGGTARYVDIYNSSGTMYLRARNDTANGPIIFQGGGGGTNTEYARFQSSGYFGLGTTGPSRRLHVKDTNYNVARLERDGSGGGVALEFRNGDGNIWQVSNDGDEVLRFYYASNNRFQVTSTGAATFNNAFTFPTTDGSANQVLKTDGSGNVSWATEAASSANTSISDADGDTKIQVEEGTDDDTIRFDTAGTERMIIDATGNVGINTTTLTKTLNVGGTFLATGEVFFSHFDNITSSSRMRDDLRLNFGTARTFAITGNSTNMHMKNGTTDVMTFDTSNRVGIGTTSPGNKLSINTSANGDGLDILSNNTKVGTFGRTVNGSTVVASLDGVTGRAINVGGNVNTSIILGAAGGKVGVGTTSPNARFQVEEAGIDTTTTNTTATTQVAIDTFVAATFRSARYTIQVTNSTDSTYHITEILLIHDGTTPQITEYGTIFTGSAEATFDADISSGNVRLLATPATTDSMTFKVVRHCITV